MKHSKPIYRVYLRDASGMVFDDSKTATPDQNAALIAFSDLVNRDDLDGQKIAAAITYNQKQIAFHRFDKNPGNADYWRGRTHEIEWPNGSRLPGKFDDAQESTIATPAEIIQARKASGLTQTKAADLVYVHRSAWAKWEMGEREMPTGLFELFLLKTGQKLLVLYKS